MSTKFFIGLLLLGVCSTAWGQKFRDTGLSHHERIRDLMEQLSLDEKINILLATSEAIPRLGIDKYHHGNEGLHGVVRPGKFTVFPQAIGLAATWNPELIYQVSTTVSDEARAKWNYFKQGKEQKELYSDLLTLWSPTVNMARDPRWGRTPETYGEDPFLSSKIGLAFTRGLQGPDPLYLKTVSTPKHFAANNEEHNRFECNAEISERALREYYLPAFKALVVEGKAEAIMSAYNAINGVPCSANSWLLNDLLRKEWGFNGYVVSDCGALGFLESHHHYVGDRSEAAAEALKAGVDLECIGEVYKMHLRPAWESGKVSVADIDTAVYRVLRARFKLGIFDPEEKNPYAGLSPDIIGSEKHQKLALETALQSMVLLKNEGKLLPLRESNLKKIAVLGPNASIAEFGDYSGEPVIEAVDPLSGIEQRVGGSVEVVTLSWNYEAGNYSLIESRFFTSSTGKEKGLSAEYFKNRNLEGEAIKRIDAMINFDPLNQPPDPGVPLFPRSIRWTGFLNPVVSGEYQMAVKSDDGVRLWIDEKLVSDNWVDRSETLDDFTMTLEAGRAYELRLEYYDGAGSAICQLMWQLPGSRNESQFARDKEVASESDLVIAVLGINKNIEREGIDRESIELPLKQQEYIKALYGVNKNTVVVLCAGSAQSINWIDANIPAVLNAWYPGESGGTAIASVLFGDYTPGGKLPFTYYKSAWDLPPFDDYEISKGRTYMYFEGEPLYPFGYGLSYTTFSFSKLRCNKKKYSVSETIELSLELANTGDHWGSEVVQVYVRDLASKEKQALKVLKGFERVELERGEKKEIHVNIPVSELKHWDSNAHAWSLEPGVFEFLIGSSSEEIRLTKRITIR